MKLGSYAAKYSSGRISSLYARYSASLLYIRRFEILLVSLGVLFGASEILNYLGNSIFLARNSSAQNQASVVQSSQAWPAFANLMLASVLCVGLNCLTLRIGSEIPGRVRFRDFKGVFEIGAMFALLFSGASLTGLDVKILDTEIIKGMKIVSLIPIIVLVCFLAAAYRVGSTRLDTEKEVAEEEPYPLEITFSKLVIFQSFLPTAIMLSPFLVATGQILDYGTVFVTGLLYLWGPASLALSVQLVTEKGWRRYGYVYLNMATVFFALVGGLIGVAMIFTHVLLSFQPYLLIVASLIMYVGYTLRPQTHTSSQSKEQTASDIMKFSVNKPEFGSKELDDAIKRLERYVQSSVSGQLLVEWIYMFIAVMFAALLSLVIQYSESFWGDVLGTIAVFLLAGLLYDLPSAWRRLLVWRDVI